MSTAKQHRGTRNRHQEYPGRADPHSTVADTMLDDRYLFRKDSLVFMPNESYHFDPVAWGSTVNEFDPYRFIKSQDQKPHHPDAFRDFEGRANLRLDLFFAINEILALGVMIALRYNIIPVTRGWAHPRTNKSNMSLILNPPRRKILMHIKSRKDEIDDSWAFSFL